LLRDRQLPRRYLSLRRDIYKPPIAASPFPFKILVLPREVRLLEQFFPTRAVNSIAPVGEGDPDFGKILSGEGLFMLLAKMPLALGCSAILQQFIHALRVLHPDGDGKLIAFDLATVPVAPKDQFLLLVPE